MNLGLFLSPGDSLTKQKQSGQLDRFIRYYLEPYSKNFNQIYLFSYGDYCQSFILPSKFSLLSKPKLIPNYLYQFLIPFIYQQIVRQVDVFRVFQAPGGIPALISKIFFKTPYIVSNNYDYVRLARMENRPILAFLLKVIIPLILYPAAKVITPEIIPNGVDPKIFKPGKHLKQPYLVLSIGRLTLQKNYPQLIKVIAFSRNKDRVKLIIIGTGRQKKTLIKLAAKLGVMLEIIPNVNHSKLVGWYQKAAVFSLTSRLEGQSKVLLEAMSSACACLTTGFPGNIIQDGVSGMTGGSVSQLSAKLDQLLSDPGLSLKLGMQARRLVISRFDLSKLVLKEIKLLKQNVKKNH